MDKAPDFGSGDCRFESCHGRYFFLAKWIAIVDFTCNISCISFSFSALVSTGLSTINFHSTHPNMFANFPNVFVHVVKIKNLRILWSVCNSLLQWIWQRASIEDLVFLLWDPYWSDLEEDFFRQLLVVLVLVMSEFEYCPIFHFLCFTDSYNLTYSESS